MVKSIVLGIVLSFGVLISGAFCAEYTVGVEAIDYTPFYSSQGGDYVGFGRDLLDLFAEKQGCRFVYKPLPVKRLFSSFLNKSIDFKFPDHPNWQMGMKKGKDVVYSQPILQTREGLMVLPENKGKGIDHIKIIGTVMGFSPWEYMKMADSGQITLVENANFSNLLQQVIGKRIDGAYINVTVATYHLKHELNKSGALVFDETLPYGKNEYHLSTIELGNMIEAFNQFLKDSAPLIQALKVKYGIDH